MKNRFLVYKIIHKITDKLGFTKNNKIIVKKTEKNTSGFTLLELSIVMVIIGFLSVGIIRGYGLIIASRILTLTNELFLYSSSAEQFEAKYGNLPGILENPTRKLGSSAAKYYVDGNKSNPFVINESGNVTNGESINFFNHLSVAGYLEGAEYKGTTMNLNDKKSITKKSRYYPTLKSIGGFFVYVRGDDIDGNYNKINRLAISSYGDKKNGINASIVWGLDSKIDDGFPLTGNIALVPTAIYNEKK